MVHLILDFEPISDNFQEVGHAIRAGDLRLCRIDVSVPGFFAREDVVPIELPPILALPEAAAPKEETNFILRKKERCGHILLRSRTLRVSLTEL